MPDAEKDQSSPSVEDYLRATAEAVGVSPDGAVAALDQTLARNRDAENDQQRAAHLVEENEAQRARAIVDGEAVQAVCGKVWVPSRAPERFPLCPDCVEHVRWGWMA